MSSAGSPRPATWLERVAIPCVLVVLAIVAIVGSARYAPPRPAPVDAPAARFSAARARATLVDLLGDGAPHPLGSPAIDGVRARLVAKLESMGLAPSVVESSACSDDQVCGRVRDVVASIEGTERGHSVLVAAHYDSVGAGPGVADDLANVAAILEIARALRAGPPLRHRVLLLLDEGEELGLLGARAFRSGSPLSNDIAAVVNLEARGVSGPSLLFETGRGNSRVASIAHDIDRPVTSSAFVAVYRRLPNDTDFTVFRRAGLEGANLAFIGGASHYHTPLDSLENLDLGSVQHQGDSALALVRGFASSDLATPARGESVWFDVMALGVVAWPMGATWIALVLALALFAVASARVGAEQRRGLGWSVLAVFAALVITAAAGEGIGLLRGALGKNEPWGRSAGAIDLAAMALAWISMVAALHFASARKGATVVHAWVASWGALAVLALVSAVVMPGAAYVLVVPSIVAGVLGVIASARWRAFASAWIAGSVVSATILAALWFPLGSLLYAAIGASPLLMGAIFAIVLVPFAPALIAASARGRKIALLAGAIAAVAFVAVALASPASTRRRRSITYLHDAQSGRAHWIVAGPGRSLGFAAPAGATFSLEQTPSVPWVPRPRLAADAPALGDAPPTAEIVSDETRSGNRHVVIRARSHRGATEVTVALAPTVHVTSARIAGAIVPLAAAGEWNLVTFVTTPADGFDLELETPAGPISGFVVDTNHGLPPFGAALRSARDASALTSGDGDVTSMMAPVSL